VRSRLETQWENVRIGQHANFVPGHSIRRESRGISAFAVADCWQNESVRDGKQ